MLQADGLTGLLDSRSFSSLWYWVIVIGIWSLAGRHVLSVPLEIVLRARQDIRRGAPEGPAMITLLDWLSLILPRWQIGRREAVIFCALGAFILTSLIIFGFGYDLETAQALVLILLPLLALFGLRMRAARRLTVLLNVVQNDQRQAAEIAPKVIGIMIWHRRQVMLLAMVSTGVTAMVGVVWLLNHPNGM